MTGIRKLESMFSYRVLLHRTYFDFILCTASYRYLLQLEMHVSLICIIKFYLLTYLYRLALLYLDRPAYV